MERFKNLSLKKKRTLAIAGVSLVTLTIVGTIAYHQDSMFFANIFRAKDDVVEFSETFDSPDDWQPCQEIPKTAVATNKNDTPRYVRMKINEYWRTKNTQTPTDDHSTSDLALTWNDNGVEKHYAVINTQNDDSWELKSDGWYYYKTTLAKDESTLSLLKSVTFNCEVNTVGEIRYSVDGQAGESMPNEYAEANYHLYITFQMSDEEMIAARDTLYDIVAHQTNGVDTNIDFGQNASRAVGNGNGVNTLASHQRDEYPVYYFRGEVDNNVVVFNNFCWRILRTAEGGSVKLLYSGAYSNGTCPGTNNNFSIGSASLQNYYYDVINHGYMMSNKHYETDFSNITGAGGQGTYYAYYMSDAVEWDGTKYNLVNPVRTNGTYSSPDTRIRQYPYHCRSSEEMSCTKVYYQYNYMDDVNNGKAIVLKDGDMIEDALAAMERNDVDSAAKTKVDAWYENNITENRDKIADVIYCNDRSILHGGLSDIDSTMGYILNYGGWVRMGGTDSNGTPVPNIDCRRDVDKFTVNSANGNGDLTYPIALPTADEYTLGGMGFSGSLFDQYGYSFSPRYNNNNAYDTHYLYSSSNEWMLSSAVAWSYNVVYLNGSGGNLNWTDATASGGLRPVLALIHDTYVQSGTGTLSDPYILEW